MTIRSAVLAALVAACGAAPAGAQPAPVTSATSLAVTAGGSRADEATRLVLGGSARWELTPHLAFEGVGRWMDRARHPDAYAGELAVVLGLSGTRESAVPYVVGGVGIHRRSFHREDGAPAAPEFYRRRFADAVSRAGPRETFTDPTLALGIGVDLPVGGQITVRPDLRALVLFGGGRRDTVWVGTVSVGYRFQHRPVTPARR